MQFQNTGCHGASLLLLTEMHRRSNEVRPVGAGGVGTVGAQSGVATGMARPLGTAGGTGGVATASVARPLGTAGAASSCAPPGSSTVTSTGNAEATYDL